MASNTKILIKRSESSNTPGILNSGELAYSYASNTLFIGTPGSDGYVEIGHYSNLSSLTAGTYGDATNIPIITVDAHGTVTGVSTSQISTTLSLDSNDGSNSMSLLDGTLSVLGNQGITTYIDENTSTINVSTDDTILRSNTESAGTQHISTDIEISGNLVVQGTTTYVQTAVNQTDDSLLELAANNTVGDVLDIGFYGKHELSGNTVVTGLVRNAGTSDYYLFDNILIGEQANLTSNLITQSSMAINGASLIGKRFLAAESEDTSGGYGFTEDGAQDTGMYSAGDGALQFKSNGSDNFTIGTGSFLHYTDISLRSQGQINNPAESSGDGLNASTLELIPDASLESDQYIVIDPTTPNHIHLRAGGTIDGSSAELILGGEQTHVQVSDGSDNVTIKTNSDYNWTFGSDGTLQLPNGAALGDHNNSSVFFGQYAGQNSQGQQAVAIGEYAGQTNQGTKSVAIGQSAGNSDQGGWSVAVGLNAANLQQGTSAVAIGHRAGSDYQGTHAVAVGVNAGQNSQGQGATALGYRAGYGDNSPQGDYSLALGAYAGQFSQAAYSIALNATGDNLDPTESGFYVAPIRNETAVGGNVAVYNTNTKEVVYTDVTIANTGITLANGTTISDSESGLFIDPIREDSTASDILYYNSDTKEVTYGTLADIRADVLSNGAYSWTISGDNGSLTSNVGTSIAASGDSVIIGQNVDLTNSNANRVAIGNGAGQTNQGFSSVAVGEGAGNVNQEFLSVAIGTNAGNDSQGHSAVAVGHTAGRVNQGADSVAIGVAAGQTNQGQYSVAIGERAGYGNDGSLGQYAIAIGARAAYDWGTDYSIILNASGDTLNSSTSGLFINPVRFTETQDATDDGIMFYNQSTKEVRYSYALDGGTF